MSSPRRHAKPAAPCGASNLLQEMLRNVNRGKGQPVEEAATEEITPAPG
jgi:hypothetical protein